MLKQKEAVFQAICALRGAQEFNGAVELSKDERAQVMSTLYADFQAGKIQFDGELPAEKELRSYVSGLISNWLRKDSRLNGNTKYVPKNPGTRTGVGDEAMKAMRALLAVTTEPEARRNIEAEIEKRALELKPKKEINIDALPENLRHLAVQQ
jgi:hypothetical protein